MQEGLRGPSRGAGGSSEETESRSFPVWCRCPKREYKREDGKIKFKESNERKEDTVVEIGKERKAFQ